MHNPDIKGVGALSLLGGAAPKPLLIVIRVASVS
jgi:hypothetical protein